MVIYLEKEKLEYSTKKNQKEIDLYLRRNPNFGTIDYKEYDFEYIFELGTYAETNFPFIDTLLIDKSGKLIQSGNKSRFNRFIQMTKADSKKLKKYYRWESNINRLK